MMGIKEPANEAASVPSTSPGETGLNRGDTNINQREGVGGFFEVEQTALARGGERTPARPLLIRETRWRRQE